LLKGVTLSDTVLTRIDAGRRHPVTLSLATSVAIQGFNVLTGVVLARALGPAGRGELAAVLLWPSILAAVGSLGVAEAATYETASGSSPAEAVYGGSLTIAGVQSLALIAIGAVVIPIVHGHDREIARSTYLFLLFIPLNLLTLYAAGILNGLHRFAAYQALRLMVFALMAGGLVLLAVQQVLTVRAALMVYLIANAVTAVVALLLLRRQAASSLTFKYETVRRLLRFGLRSHTTNVASLLNERLDQLVISVFLAPAKLGLYVIAVTLTSATMIIGNATGMVILPMVASLEDPAERITVASRYVGWVLVGAACVAVPMVAFTPLLIRVFFGYDFLGATTVTRVLLVATVLLSANRVIGALLKAVGRPLDAGVAELLSLGMTVGGLALLLPRLELLGAGLTSLMAYGVTTAWMTLKAARALDVPPTVLLVPGGRGRRSGN
jgi:O-antigen/teichoic acid export membrane protein